VVELGRASDRELADRYEAGCEAYDELYLSEQLEKYEAALRLLRPRGRVVDVGCGTGLLIEYMAREGLLEAVDLYVCVDVSGCMLERARQRALALCRGKCAVMQGDAYSLPFVDKAFDVGYSFSVVNLLERPEEALRELGRVSGSALATAIVKLGEPPQLPPGWARAGVAGKDAVYIMT
jgi:ubiquinone/menaquinone biosynthesis C-methylase UbiE